MIENLSSAILKNTYSLEEAYVRIDMLQRALEHGFFKGGDTGQERSAFLVSYYHDSDEDTQRHARAIAAWDKSVLDRFSTDTLYARIQELKDSVETLPRLMLYVPARLSGQAVERIAQWCRAELQADLMLDIRIDASAIGGCNFVYKNTFHDFSFSYFATKEREKLVKLLETYA